MGLTCFSAEPIRIDIQDNYYVGESLQIRLIFPSKIARGFLLLQGPDGTLSTVIPNEFESFETEGKQSGKRLFPDPSLAYQIVLAKAGTYRVWSVHLSGERDRPAAAIRWPDELPEDFPAALRKLSEGGVPLEGTSGLVYSHLDFTVKAGKRPAGEQLEFHNGILDGLDNPKFLPGQTRLSTTQDYRLLWKWARLINSPAHRHQSFIIECHATTQQGRKKNLTLSQERADEIVRYFVEKCHVPAERLSATGKGDFEPLPNQATNALVQNRVTLVLDNTAGARTLQ